LRTVTPDANNSFVLENAVLDTGSGTTFRFTQGTLYMLTPVGGRVSGAVFLGDGSFSLKPPDEVEDRQLRRFTGGRPEVEEPFRELVLVATDETVTKLAAGLNARPAPELSKAGDVLQDFRKLFRDTLRRNIEARLLAGFCSPRERLLIADIHGRKNGRSCSSSIRRATTKCCSSIRNAICLTPGRRFTCPATRVPPPVRWSTPWPRRSM